MKVDFTCKRGLLKLKFFPEINERSDYTGNIKMEREACFIRMPEDWTVDSIHPDLFAMAIVLIVYPFIYDEIDIGIGVSKSFHDEFLRITGKKILPVNKTLKPRKSKKNARPALAFSGGVDSTVALTLLPEETCCVFVDRVVPKDMTNQTLYNKEFVYNACNYLSRLGKGVYTIETDFEYIRSPRGFVIEYSTSVPAILLADYNNGFDSISSGTVLESAYLEFKDFNATRLYHIDWRNLFNVIDLPRNDVTAGLSNVATLKILYKDQRYIDFVKSCMSGDRVSTCFNCWKCFRKTLILKALFGDEIQDTLIDELFLITEARTYLRRLPIRFENQFVYITAKYQGNHPLMVLLKRLTKGDRLEYEWMEKWYSPSREHISKKYCNVIESNIRKYVETMSKKEEVIVQRWESREDYRTKTYQEQHQKFIDAMITHRNVFKNHLLMQKK